MHSLCIADAAKAIADRAQRERDQLSQYEQSVYETVEAAANHHYSLCVTTTVTASYTRGVLRTRHPWTNIPPSPFPIFSPASAPFLSLPLFPPSHPSLPLHVLPFSPLPSPPSKVTCHICCYLVFHHPLTLSFQA